MAVYESKYRELKFYVEGGLHAFSGGSFSTTDAKVIAVLDKLSDVTKQAEEAPAKPKSAPKKATASAK